MSRVFAVLARHRSASVGLAVLVECGVLVPLAFAEPSAVVGLPAAVAAAIAGTVAVVFGPLDGALVALVGAAVFGSAGGWQAGEPAALAVWPAVVVAAGLFARRIERQRRALAQLVASQETERHRIALELHDETAQVLAAALMALRQAEGAATADEAGAANRTTRALIQQTIRNVRELAVDLRPMALDDFGLAPALERLAATYAQRTGIAVDVDARPGEERLPPEAEITIYRTVQEVLAHIAGGEAGGRVHVAIDRAPADVHILIEHDRPDRHGATKAGWTSELASLRERLRLAGGRLDARSGATGTVVKAHLPVR
ncbi:Histidine kinase [Gaiella occulta]|uniref:histidine kinase n=1 Tax=Gaiella occulta TaxID=1002870 RepID=A0A7M2YYD1_9ACTN|nr:histidine kinase [Gaiella occulta]RDI75165.1 Histidine kinase [Gaiella occulta]